MYYRAGVEYGNKRKRENLVIWWIVVGHLMQVECFHVHVRTPYGLRLTNALHCKCILTPAGIELLYLWSLFSPLPNLSSVG